MKRNLKRYLTFLLAIVLVLPLGVPAFAADSTSTEPIRFEISNPYANVDWNSFYQFRAANHVHTKQSDGNNTLRETVLDHYNHGYHILAITDHGTLTNRWDESALVTMYSALRPTSELLTTKEKDAIYAGTFTASSFVGYFSAPRRNTPHGMIRIPYSNEQAYPQHVLTYWAQFNSTPADTIEGVLKKAETLGGLSILPHPGRYTRSPDGKSGGADGGVGGEQASNNPAEIAKYVRLFRQFNSAVGMEIINKLDGESRSDRILWDNILMELMPEGRPVWGFSNDDTHSVNGTGFSWNVMLMPKLTEEAVRTSMETGAFYAVTRVDRKLGVNTTMPGGGAMPVVSPHTEAKTAFLIEQSAPPSIANIVVGADTITITGRNYDRIEWIADGVVIAQGPTLDIHAHRNKINSYVRAQLISRTGVAFTQPFGIAVVPASHEYHAAYMFGNGAGKFHPKASITRAEVAATLTRTRLFNFAADIRHLPPGMDVFDTFSDVNTTDWFYYHVAWAYDAGFIQGYGGEFRPNDLVTREEFAAMLARTTVNRVPGDAPFGDADQISDWAKDDVSTVYNEGWMMGDKAGNFNPASCITRAEAATAMNRRLSRIACRDTFAAAAVEGVAYARPFRDVEQGAWYFPAVMVATNDHRLIRNEYGAIVWVKIVIG